MDIPFRKRTSIKSKLFFVILFFVCAPLILFGYFWYEKTTSSLEQNAIQYSQHLLSQTNQYLNFYLEDLEKATAPFQTNQQVQEYVALKPQPKDKFTTFQLSKQIQEEAFASILNGRSDIFGISLINKNVMQVNNYSQVSRFLDMDKIRSRNNELWRKVDTFDTYEVLDVEEIQNTPVIPIVRKLYDKRTYETTGLLIIHLQLNQLAKIINEITLSHFNNVWIVNENDKIMYHSNEELLETTSIPISTFQSNISVQRENKENTLLVGEDFPNTELNWGLIASVPMDRIMGNLIELRNSTIWVGLILIGAALFFVGGFSFSLTYSLENLQKLMKSAESGNLNLERKKPFPLYQNDEVSDLYNSFYTMTTELDRLIEQVHLAKLKEKELELKTRESELQAMQSQINPHFLYNTLEIINSYAIIENQPIISNMTTSLADMFRYNVSNTKKVVTLQEEMDQIKAYLQIQQQRFEKLHVIYDLKNADLQEVITTRITLQPIIENAFIHGYEEHQLAPEFIGIYGKKTTCYYQVFVVDLGKGMSPDTIETYNYAFTHNADPPEGQKTTKRIGLMNVHKRLSTQFGSPYGLSIQKSDEMGTVIEVRLPFAIEEQKKEA
ncbi:sensor histidine kinase [Pontibacillus yanchengensis]|uniref:Histidine kinase n=1 Tax=Pontibacillus yanchengensis Y32 TaxID=1385514 RepID=A0A0A2T7X3_9BACI|nr:sensor histidine kinase [Pontibacillus yanchengensis]KGP71867.1 histidine kinase [Pontibacillus yanchengensis Y32]